jgi:hypothetical protein
VNTVIAPFTSVAGHNISDASAINPDGVKLPEEMWNILFTFFFHDEELLVLDFVKSKILLFSN